MPEQIAGVRRMEQSVGIKAGWLSDTHIIAYNQKVLYLFY